MTLCGRRIDARPLELVLICMALAVLGDLAHMVLSGSASAILWTHADGGIVPRGDQWYFLGNAWGGPVAAVLLAISMVLVAMRVATRPALVIGLLAYAQIGHLFGPGDRAIDRLIRTVFLLFLFSRVTAPKRSARVEAWISVVFRVLLVLVYLQAGLVKADSTTWLLPSEQPELLSILADPLAGRLDHLFWQDYPTIFWVFGAAAVALELAAPLILTRWAPYWALGAIWIHIGIICTMHLGMFSFGMLAFYPLLFTPWTIQLCDRVGWRRPEI